MNKPTIEVDNVTYDLVANYVNSWVNYYFDEISQIRNGVNVSDLPDDLRRIVSVYHARINTLTLFLCNMECYDLPFSE